MTTCQHLHPVDVVSPARGDAANQAIGAPDADTRIRRRGSRKFKVPGEPIRRFVQC
jgi:hypothetical protein